MLSYKIPNNLIVKLRELSKSFALLQQEAESLSSDELDYIKRSSLISNIGASTRIENAVLTNAEIDWIDTTLTKDGKTTAFYDQQGCIEDKLSKDKERSIEEVVGCRAMLNLIYEEGREFFPLSEVTLRGLHKELLRYYDKADEYSGSYKQKPNSVVRVSGSKEYPVLTTAEPGVETQDAMAELIKWYNNILPEHPWTIAVAIELVFRFLAIHPFQDGNGRLGRGLLSLVLLQSPDSTLAFMIPYLPIDRYIEKERENYYLVLRKCSDGKFLKDPTKYQYHHFLRFMINVIQGAISDFKFYQIRYDNYQKLSESAHAVLSCFKEYPERRLQIKLILQETGLPRRTANDALKQLVNKEFIQRYGQGAGIRYQLIF